MPVRGARLRSLKSPFALEIGAKAKGELACFLCCTVACCTKTEIWSLSACLVWLFISSFNHLLHFCVPFATRSQSVLFLFQAEQVCRLLDAS